MLGQLRMPDFTRDEWDDMQEGWEPIVPWDETCARCGGLFSIDNMVAEEGDEWECFGCNERCNDKDLIAEMALRAITKYLSKG